MTNINALTNITPLEMNNSIVNNGSIIENTIEQVNNTIPWWFFSSTTVLFIILVWYIYKKQDLIKLDLMQSVMFSSFFVTLVSYSIVATGISNSIVPLTFFGLIWILSIVGMFYVKKRG